MHSGVRQVRERMSTCWHVNEASVFELNKVQVYSTCVRNCICSLVLFPLVMHHGAFGRNQFCTSVGRHR
jgi:hypothetical protein